MEGKWYFTGDLGYIKNKKLYLTGRSKDVIIVNGKNIYATDIERRLEEILVASIRPGCSAAFQVGDDEAVVICEFKPGQESSVDSDLLFTVKKELENEFGLKMKSIVCTSKGTVPKTTSGKIRRSEAKKIFNDGLIESITGLENQISFEKFEDLLTHYGVVDSEKTLIENGVDSLKLSQLMEESSKQFGIYINLADANTVPCKLLDVMDESSSIPNPLPNYDDYPLQGERISLTAIVQLLGLISVLASILFCVIPVGYYVEVTQNHQWHDNALLDSVIKFIFISLAPIVWMISYTLLCFSAKWIVIYRYKKSRHALWSWYFFRWWYVERLFDFWEAMVGAYFLDTPYINCFYYILGCDCDLTQTRFEVFIRNFDLWQVRKSQIAGVGNTALVDTNGLLFDVLIFENVKLENRSTYYPGTRITMDLEKCLSIKKWEEINLFEKTQRYLFPLIVWMVYLSAFLLFGFIISFLKAKSIFMETFQVVVMILGPSLYLNLVAGILGRCEVSFIADRLVIITYRTLYVWTGLTVIDTAIQKWFYGTKMDWMVQLNGFLGLLPSKGRYITIERGCTVSHCSYTASKTSPIVIGRNVTIGAFATIESGSIIEDNCAIATYGHVTDPIVKTNTAYFNSNFQITSNENNSSALGPLVLLTQLCLRICFQWIPIYFMLMFMVFSFKHMLVNAKGIPDPLRLCFGIGTAFVIGGVSFIFLDVLYTKIFLRATKEKHFKMKAGSLKSLLYSIQICQHFARIMFIDPFLKGTIWLVYIEMLCGLQVDKPSKALLFGSLYDNSWLSINCDSNENYGFVMDRDSIYSAHMMEHGYLVLKKTSSKYNVAFHEGAMGSSQSYGPNICLGLRSRVFFRNSVVKNTSGVYFGSIASECAETQ
jgi:acyl carrier protein